MYQQYCIQFIALYLLQQLILLMLQIICILFVLYAVVAYVRRLLAKPNYQGKIVWITGASSGIGEFLAYEFNQRGAYVIISARNQKELLRVKQSSPHPQLVQVLPMDMINYAAVRTITQGLVDRLERQGKKLEVVVQNAGTSMRCEFINYSFENHISLFDVNVHGPYNHIQAVVPHMIKNKGGQIVGISSLSGKLSTAYRSSYGGSKHALIGILDSLRTELLPYGIRVCNVMPGYIKTNLSKNALAAGPGQKFGVTDSNIDKGMDPAKFAKQAVAAIYNKQNEVSISEQWLPILGMVLRNICPDLFCRFMLLNAKNQSKAIADGKKSA